MAVGVSNNDSSSNEKDTQFWSTDPWSRNAAANKKGITYKKSRDYSKNEDGSDKVGIGKTAGDITNWLTDLGRNVANFEGTVNAWLGSYDPVVNGNKGDMLFGRAWTDAEKGIKKPETVTPPPGSGGSGSSGGSAAQSLFDQLMDNWQDPYAAARSTLSANSLANQARLTAMYNQVADYIRGMSGDVNAIYDKAAQEYQASNQTAQNSLNAGYGTAASQLGNVLKALGIEDAAKVAMSRNEDLQKNQTASVSDLANVLSSNLNRNAGNRTAALEGLTNTASATQASGALAQERYARDVASQLASLLGQSASARNNYMSSIASSQADAEKAAASAPTSISADQIQEYQKRQYDLYIQQNIPPEKAAQLAQDDLNNYLGTLGY